MRAVTAAFALLVVASVPRALCAPLPACNLTRWEGACIWPNTPPPDCPFAQSPDFAGVAFSGVFGAYPTTKADTWYPSVGGDGRLYTSFADGHVCTSAAPAPPPPPPVSLTALQWWWSAARTDNVLTTAQLPPDAAGKYELVGVIGYALAGATDGGACELELFRAPAGTQEYWTVCGAAEAAAATAAGYARVGALGAFLPSAAPPVNLTVPPTVRYDMPAGEVSGWQGTNQLFSAARGDHYASPEHLLPDGYAQQRALGYMRVELPQQACAEVDGANTGVQGVAVLEGSSAFELSVTSIGTVPHPPFTANVSFPGMLGMYPSTSFVFKAQWVFGYYLLADSNGKGCGAWCHLGPLVAFGVADIPAASGGPAGAWSFAQSPYWGGGAVQSGVFEPLDVTRPIRMGVPRFVDFGADLQHSPDGRAYLLGKGCSANNGVNCSFMTGDSAFLARTIQPLDALGNLTALNVAANWEFFGGSGGPWVPALADAQPLFEWPTGVGGLTMTFNAALKRYFIVSNLPGDRVHPKNCAFDTALLESDAVTGPFRLVSYMRALGPQMYFQQLSSKFWSADGLTGALFSSGNWDGACITQGSNPPGERYGLVTTEVMLVPG